MSQGFLDGYNGIKIELPNGRTVTGKVLPLKRAIYYLGLWTQKDGAGRDTVLLEFPKEVGLESELDELTYLEFVEVFDAFFDRRAKPGSPAPTPSPAVPTGTASLPSTPPTSASPTP